MTWNPAFPAWVLVPAAVFGFGSVALLVRRSALFRKPRERWLVGGLRSLVVALLLLVMGGPVVQRAAGEGEGAAPVLVLLDTSASMALGEGQSRFDQAREVLAGVIEENRLARRLRILPFAGELSPQPLALSDLADLEATGSSTRLAATLGRAIPLAAGARARRLVIFSDGRSQDREELGDVALAARRSRLAVSAYPVGAVADRPAVRIRACRVERQVPAFARVPVEIELGLVQAEGRTARLHLREGDEVVDAVAFPAGGEQVVRRTLFCAVEREDRALEVVASLDGEEQPPQRFPFRLAVVEPKLRVLYMEGSNHPNKRWQDIMEYEFIPAALREAGNIEVDVLTVDEQLAAGGRLYHIDDEERGYPTSREELFAYDVVICSDINRSIFSDEQLEWTRQLVAENGGGFAMIGGYTAFGAGGWDRTVWEQLIPVDMVTQDEGYLWEDIPVAIPPPARLHPIWHLAGEPIENERILAAHPIFKGTNLVNRAKPGAQVLAYWERRDMPLVAVQSYGRGRSLAFTSDAAGGWGEHYQTEWGEGERDNRHYRRFWLNTVRWLAENSLASHRTAFLATADALQYRPGETVALRARFHLLDEPARLRPFTVAARLAEVPGIVATLQLDPARARFVGSLPLPADLAGEQATIHLTATNPDRETAGEQHLVLGLDHTSLEQAEPEPDHAALATLAELTGGELLATPGQFRELLARPPEQPGPAARRYAVPLWDSGWLWFLAILAMSAEWFYRKILRFR